MYSVDIIDTQNNTNTLYFRQFEYPNLMELIIDNLYDDIGECLGRGLCGSCHINIISGEIHDNMEPHETETISKLKNTNYKSRLACQIMLNKKINNMTFKIISDTKYITL